MTRGVHDNGGIHSPPICVPYILSRYYKGNIESINVYPADVVLPSQA
jgi:hypothetical protein